MICFEILEWILGFIALVVMKLIHLLIIFMAGNHSSALTSGGISRTISTHTENNGNSIAEISFPPIKYHLWLGLGFNAFTCGILLGTVIYHLIPQVGSICSITSSVLSIIEDLSSTK